MHFSIPDTQEMNEKNGSTFMAYNMHINGVFHCTVRYRQLLNLHSQLRKQFGQDDLPSFPPKKLLPLTSSQLEERRMQLEKYIQLLGQHSKLVSSEILVGFLLSAQQETSCEKKQEMKLDIYTMNNYLISIRILSTDRTEQVLAKACRQINLPPEYNSYFALFLIRKEENGEITILRKLQDFESPYISHKSAHDFKRIVIRKCYWDAAYDLELMSESAALNLLYAQTICDLEHGWVLCGREVRAQLAHLQARLAKREYLELARTLKYYGYVQFRACWCDYPRPGTRVQVAVGGEELSIRLLMSGTNAPGSSAQQQQIPTVMKEGCFKVTRMKCWRITAVHNKLSNDARTNGSGGESIATTGNSSSTNATAELEISFEYLMAKDKLQWITIASEQAILISVCLQSMVDELLMKKNGVNPNSRQFYNGQQQQLQGNNGASAWSYMKRDGSSQIISLDEPDIHPNCHAEELTHSTDISASSSGAGSRTVSVTTDTETSSVSGDGSKYITNGESSSSTSSSSKADDSFSIKRLQEKFSSVSFKSGKEFVENDAFEGIGDDDL